MENKKLLKNFSDVTKRYFDAADCGVVDISAPLSGEAKMILYKNAEEAINQQKEQQKDVKEDWGAGYV
ncbi:MAG: hypothetical protein MJZ34_03160 [Paludibacteraceae bacterium]|nr:hypothetical protein [Paludibacteraceae bacterium]